VTFLKITGTGGGNAGNVRASFFAPLEFRALNDYVLAATRRQNAAATSRVFHLSSQTLKGGLHMKLNLENLNVLREKITTATDFSQPWNYFFDHFGENPLFVNVGKRVSHPELESVLKQVSWRLIGKVNVKLADLLVIEVAEYAFYHGIYFLEGRMSSFMFFADINLGMVGIVPARSGGDTQFGRFSLTTVTDKVSPVISPSSKN
jgi:hypothetical protein